MTDMIQKHYLSKSIYRASLTAEMYYGIKDFFCEMFASFCIVFFNRVSRKNEFK